MVKFCSCKFLVRHVFIPPSVCVLKEETLLVDISSRWPAAGPSVPAKRKPDPSDEYLERIISRKMADISPSKLNEYSQYAGMQKDSKERILDDHPEPDVDIPPLPLLYRGFGHFLDSTSLAAIRSGTSSPPDIKDDVDRLVTRLRKIEDEKAKQEGTQNTAHFTRYPLSGWDRV